MHGLGIGITQSTFIEGSVQFYVKLVEANVIANNQTNVVNKTYI